MVRRTTPPGGLPTRLVALRHIRLGTGSPPAARIERLTHLRDHTSFHEGPGLFDTSGLAEGSGSWRPLHRRSPPGEAG